jgi:hypothetical protein
LSFATKGRVELHRRLQGAPPSKQKLYRRPGSGELSLNSPLGKFCLDGIEEVMIEDRRVFTLVDLATIGDLANIEAVLSTRLARCRSWKMTITRLTMIAGAFLDAKRNAIFIGGTGTDKTHLCIGVASAVICAQGPGPVLQYGALLTRSSPRFSCRRRVRPPRADNWRKAYRGSSGLTGFARAGAH